MNWQSVIEGTARYSVEQGKAEEWLRLLPDKSISLTLFSPPYEDQRTYGVGFRLKGQAWVDWLRPIIVEACRVTNGLVCVNAAGPVRDGSYSSSVEWLVADLTRLDGLVCGPAPWCWWKVCGIPGSGGSRYQRRDWEPVYAFCRPDVLPLSGTDNTAFGHPPKYAAGGEFSNRESDGSRVNDPWKTAARDGVVGGRFPDGEKKKGVRHTKRVIVRASVHGGDTMREQFYVPPKVANPGNVVPIPQTEGGSVVEARVGGNHIGGILAHQSEAPMPVKLAARFVRWYCPPNGIVLDCFAGSGTTAVAALDANRRFVGCDLRESQVRLSHKRILGVTPDLFDDADMPAELSVDPTT